MIGVWVYQTHFHFLQLLSLFLIYNIFDLSICTSCDSPSFQSMFSIENLRFWYANTIYQLSHSFILKSLKNTIFLIFYKYLHGFLLFSVIFAFVWRLCSSTTLNGSACWSAQGRSLCTPVSIFLWFHINLMSKIIPLTLPKKKTQRHSK